MSLSSMGSERCFPESSCFDPISTETPPAGLRLNEEFTAFIIYLVYISRTLLAPGENQSHGELPGTRLVSLEPIRRLIENAADTADEYLSELRRQHQTTGRRLKRITKKRHCLALNEFYFGARGNETTEKRTIIIVLVIAALWCVPGMALSSAEAQLLAKSIQSGSLYETVAPDGMPVDPSFAFCLLLCLIPIGIQIFALKLIDANEGRRRFSWRFLGGMLIIVCAFAYAWGFCFFTVGWQQEQKIGSISKSASGLPFFVVAAGMNLSGLIASLCFFRAWKSVAQLFTWTIVDVFQDPYHSDCSLLHAREQQAIIETLETKGRLDAARESLAALAGFKQDRDAEEKETRRLQREIDDHQSEIDRLRRILGGFVLIIAGVLSGCGSPIAGSPTGGSVASPISEPVEMFVCDDGSIPGETKRQLVKQLLFYRLPAGSQIHYLKIPESRLVASTLIPNRSGFDRVKHPGFANAYATLDSYLSGASPPTETTERRPSVFGLPITVRDFRLTSLPVRIIFLGDLVFHDPSREALSMKEGHVPAPGYIGIPDSPFATDTRFPKDVDTQIEVGLAEANFGDNPRHRERIRKFTAAFLSEVRGQLDRITADLATVGRFREPSEPIEMATVAGPVEIVDTRIKEERVQQGTRRPGRVGVTPLSTTYTKPGSIGRRLETAGVAVNGLRMLELTTSLVCDGSGSQAEAMGKMGDSALRIAADMPDLVRSFHLGVSVRRGDGEDNFPLTKFEPSGTEQSPEEAALTAFFARISAGGGDDRLLTMLRAGIAKFEGNQKDDRRLLVLMGDCFSADDNEKRQVDELLDRWLHQAPDQHQFLMIFTGQDATAREAFIKLADRSNASIAFTTDSIIDQFVELCRDEPSQGKSTAANSSTTLTTSVSPLLREGQDHE